MNHFRSKITPIAAAALLVCGYAAPLSAASDADEFNRWYAGVGVGASDVALNEPNLSTTYAGAPGASFRQGGNTFRMFGGYRFDPLLKMELGITSFGEVVMDATAGQRNLFTSDSGYLSALISRPISKNIDIQARLGMSFWTLYDKDDNTIESGQGLLYGAGLDINLYGEKARTLLLEWEHYNFSGVALEEADAFNASIKFSF